MGSVLAMGLLMVMGSGCFNGGRETKGKHVQDKSSHFISKILKQSVPDAISTDSTSLK